MPDIPRIALAIGTCILMISQMPANAQAPTLVKTWRFELANGTLQIALQAYPDGRSSLGIGPADNGRMAPVEEQVEPLKQVLAEMPNFGADPQKLSYIGMRDWGADVTGKLAYACIDSQECRFTVESPAKEKVRVLVALLNQCAAFEPYNEVFRVYGMRARVTSAEKLGLIRFSSVPPRNSSDRARGNMLVLGYAYIGMRFSPVDAAPQQNKK